MAPEPAPSNGWPFIFGVVLGVALGVFFGWWGLVAVLLILSLWVLWEAARAYERGRDRSFS